MVDSNRTAANWLRNYAAARSEPATALRRWEESTKDELKQFEAGSRHTNLEFVFALFRQQLSLHQQLEQFRDVDRIFTRMVELDQSADTRVFAEFVDWLIERQQWERIEELAATYAGRFRRDARLLYTVAQARRENGDALDADDLAARAFRLNEGEGPEARLPVAYALAQRGQYDWAEIEYRESLARSTPGDEYATRTALLLGAMLHDQERNAEAADVLEKLGKALQKLELQATADADEYARIKEDYAFLMSRGSYYRACAAKQEGDVEEQKKNLDEAILANSDDIDVLIAMFHLPNASAEHRRGTIKRIERIAEDLEQQIKRFPDQARGYNNYAWLIANTTGDFSRALQYAQQAVDLADPSSLPGHLDTLARCLFALGKLDEAIEQQQRAVELEPHTGQLRRQLEEFEKARSKSVNAESS